MGVRFTDPREPPLPVSADSPAFSIGSWFRTTLRELPAWLKWEEGELAGFDTDEASSSDGWYTFTVTHVGPTKIYASPPSLHLIGDARNGGYYASPGEHTVRLVVISGVEPTDTWLPGGPWRAEYQVHEIPDGSTPEAVLAETGGFLAVGYDREPVP